MTGRLLLLPYLVGYGYNVFMGDADIVFFVNPFDLVLPNVDAMISVERLEDSGMPEWGDRFLIEYPNQSYSLNNGVWIVMHTKASLKFLDEYVVYNIDSLRDAYKNETKENQAKFYSAFLQFTFNSMAREDGFAASKLEV